ncbi:MAG: hypothetical protein HY784_08220 [Chloroflexi bacterium]|nr:hypothetical protein [Chloroflexota bacterium]
MNPENIGFGLALLAGAASFLSPCVLSLVPAYLGYLSGQALGARPVPVGVGAAVGDDVDRWQTFSHGLAFVIGFTIVFILLGVITGLLSLLFGNAAFAIGGRVYSLQKALTVVGGLVVIVFGLHTIGLIRIPFLDYDTRRQTAPDPRLGYAGSALMGVFFSAGWAPCVGPVLGAVLTMAFSASGVGRASYLLVGYSIGLAVPFLLTALAVGPVTRWIRRAGKWMRVFAIANGVLLIIIGILLASGTLATLARFGFFVNLGI